jgi:hypothetical protein
MMHRYYNVIKQICEVRKVYTVQCYSVSMGRNGVTSATE